MHVVECVFQGTEQWTSKVLREGAGQGDVRKGKSSYLESVPRKERVPKGKTTTLTSEMVLIIRRRL